MTEERLHEIDQHIADGGGDCNGTTDRALKDLVAEVRRLRTERDALLLRCKEAEAGWLLAATQRDDFAVSLVIARDGGK
jgi:hypothetical protein